MDPWNSQFPTFKHLSLNSEISSLLALMLPSLISIPQPSGQWPSAFSVCVNGLPFLPGLWTSWFPTDSPWPDLWDILAGSKQTDRAWERCLFIISLMSQCPSQSTCLSAPYSFPWRNFFIKRADLIFLNTENPGCVACMDWECIFFDDENVHI